MMVQFTVQPGECDRQAYARHCAAAIGEGMCPNGHGGLGRGGACAPCRGTWHLGDDSSTTHWCLFGHCEHI